jgi:hypothetical protein
MDIMSFWTRDRRKKNHDVFAVRNRKPAYPIGFMSRKEAGQSLRICEIPEINNELDIK